MSEQPKTKWRLGVDGTLEEYVVETGEVISRQKTKRNPDGKPVKLGQRGRPVRMDESTHHQVIDGNGKLVTVKKGTNPDDLPRSAFPYSQITCEHICRYLTEGRTLTQIGLMEGMPPTHVIYSWTRKYPEFKAELRAAKEARAEYFADKVMDIADRAESLGEKEVAGSKLAADLYKWGAEVGNRTEYGKSTKITGDANAPLSFVIETGVRFAEDQASIPTTGEPVSVPGLEADDE